jgi:hypothetical protein
MVDDECVVKKCVVDRGSSVAVGRESAMQLKGKWREQFGDDADRARLAATPGVAPAVRPGPEGPVPPESDLISAAGRRIIIFPTKQIGVNAAGSEYPAGMSSTGRCGL